MICKFSQNNSHDYGYGYGAPNWWGALLPDMSIGTVADWHHPASRPSISISAPRLVDEGIEAEQDVEVLVAEPEVAKPPMYAVIIYNDDYTPMEFVVHILQAEFKHNVEKAVEIMLNIHHKGRGMAGIFPKDIAETKAKNANQAARKGGYPLLVQIEPHQS